MPFRPKDRNVEVRNGSQLAQSGPIRPNQVQLGPIRPNQTVGPIGPKRGHSGPNSPCRSTFRPKRRSPEWSKWAQLGPIRPNQVQKGQTLEARRTQLVLCSTCVLRSRAAFLAVLRRAPVFRLCSVLCSACVLRLVAAPRPLCSTDN